MRCIALHPAPHVVSLVADSADIPSTALAWPWLQLVSAATTPSASDGLWSLMVPIGVVALFVVAVVVGVIVLRAVITRRNPEIKEP
ncbi:hypothetical protein SAMN04487783_1162 [Agrococcus baldri]|uniref:Uncharacterized protein n=1 Tax=Agrococcus baldri TaxID=153730 RepID=A0AA94HLT9_9MICO|nr:hypothetical protein [Agrococcus baldri]SFS08825.1 hypothetical protein SAMN04487783_1162 [Agrococcus baldri]